MSVELRFIDIADVLVDFRYQRAIDAKRILKIEKAFQRGAIKAISVARRPDGSQYVYDGHHTLNVCRNLGHDKIAAVIVESESWRQEAGWFLLMNGAGVSKANSREKHAAAMAAEDETALDAQKILDSYSVTISKGAAKKGLTSAINSIKAWARQDRARLIAAMDVIDRLWCNEDYAWAHTVIRGMFDVAGTPMLEDVEKGLGKYKITPRRVLDTAGGMQSATGVPGGGSGYSKKAIFKLAKVKEV